MKTPQPSSSALAHSATVVDYIANKIIQAGGAIPFHEYMQHVLYAPGLGYYSAGSLKFGESGDFITAPEISNLFSQCLGHAIAPIFKHLPEITILEVGAGSGKMAVTIVQQLAELDINVSQYFILETSADLRQRQQQIIAETIPDLYDRFVWLDSLPLTFSGVIIANELLDAMPVHIFKKNSQAVSELYVGYQNGFSLLESTTVNTRLTQRISNIENTLGYELAVDYQSEINFAAEDWLMSIDSILEKAYVLILDYGYPKKEYYHEQRNVGTLSCYLQHHRIYDPFLYPGLLDITAHIDFSSLVESLYQQKLVQQNIEDRLQLNAYTTQSQFLLASGLMEIFQNNQPSDIKQQLIQAQQIKKLTMPHEMGEIVKVIGFEKGLSGESDFELPCFSLRDLRYQL